MTATDSHRHSVASSIGTTKPIERMSPTGFGHEIQIERWRRVKVAQRRIVVGFAVENVRGASVERVALETVHTPKAAQQEEKQANDFDHSHLELIKSVRRKF